jgi:hypothetical protein
VTVNLPKNLSDDDSETVLRTLRADVDIEYAEPASPRKAEK